MRGSIRRLRPAHIAASTVALALLVLAVPAHAAAGGHSPGAPVATGAQPAPRPHPGIPINLPLGGLQVHLTVPLNLGILGGQSSSPAPSRSEPPTSEPPTSEPPITNPPSDRPTHPSTPPPAHATHHRSTPPAQPGPSLVGARHPAPQQTQASRNHRHTSHPTHSREPDRHRGIAAVLLPTQPLHGASVMLLLAVIAVFGIGVAGIVLAGGRRAQPASKHRR